MKQPLLRTPAEVVALAKKSYRSCDFESALLLLKNAEQIAPFYAPAVAWQVPVLKSMNRVTELAAILDYQKQVRIYDMLNIAAFIENDVALCQLLSEGISYREPSER